MFIETLEFNIVAYYDLLKQVKETCNEYFKSIHNMKQIKKFDKDMKESRKLYIDMLPFK